MIFYVIIFNENFLKTDFIIFKVCKFYAFIFFLHFCLYNIHESVCWNLMCYVSNQIRNEAAENLSD